MSHESTSDVGFFISINMEGVAQVFVKRILL